jgi:predicted MPP superfamily phosphohydrolase
MKTRRPAKRRPSRHRLWLAVVAVLLAAAGLGTAMLLEARSLRTHQFTVSDADLPTALDGLRVAFVSDIHHGPWVSRERVIRVVDKVNALHPDLVVLGGDYTHRDAAAIEPAFLELRRLRAPLGVYGALGNHDHWLDAAATRRAMTEAGIRDLDNRGVWLGRDPQRLRLCGVDDLWEGRQDLARALGDATPEDFVLLVSHNPDYAESLPEASVDLVLAGHTHGGQVTLFGLWAPFLPSDHGQKYRGGLVWAGDVLVLVTTGAGTTGAPLRLFAPPEIVLVMLHTARP